MKMSCNVYVYSSGVCFNTYEVLITRQIKGWAPVGLKKLVVD